MLDIRDDLDGKSCTPMTLKRIYAVVDMQGKHFGLLKTLGGLFFGDEHSSQAELFQKRNRHLRELALAYQVDARRS